jgi:hypothetical protein
LRVLRAVRCELGLLHVAGIVDGVPGPVSAEACLVVAVALKLEEREVLGALARLLGNRCSYGVVVPAERMSEGAPVPVQMWQR